MDESSRQLSRGVTQHRQLRSPTDGYADDSFKSSNGSFSRGEGALSYRHNLSQFNEKLEEITGTIFERAQMSMPGGEEGQAVDVLRDVILQTVNGASSLAEVLSSADATAAREHLKVKMASVEAKIERSRTAGRIGLQNQAAELEATFQAQMAARVAEMENGGALQEYIEENERLTQEVATLTKKVERLEQTGSALRNSLKDAEVKASTTEVNFIAMTLELKNLKDALAEALAEFDVAKAEFDVAKMESQSAKMENQSLSEHLAKLRNKYESAKTKVDNDNTNLRDSVLSMQEHIIEAHAEAQLLATAQARMAPEESARVAEDMSERLCKLTTAFEQEESHERLQRLLAELNKAKVDAAKDRAQIGSMGTKIGKMGKEIEELKQRLKSAPSPPTPVQEVPVVIDTSDADAANQRAKLERERCAALQHQVDRLENELANLAREMARAKEQQVETDRVEAELREELRRRDEEEQRRMKEVRRPQEEERRPEKEERGPEKEEEPRPAAQAAPIAPANGGTASELVALQAAAASAAARISALEEEISAARNQLIAQGVIESDLRDGGWDGRSKAQLRMYVEVMAKRVAAGVEAKEEVVAAAAEEKVGFERRVHELRIELQRKVDERDGLVKRAELAMAAVRGGTVLAPHLVRT